jgi:DNA-directed RNA polymerase subunit M/transcription elongation factor TFIIS
MNSIISVFEKSMDTYYMICPKKWNPEFTDTVPKKVIAECFNELISDVETSENHLFTEFYSVIKDSTICSAIIDSIFEWSVSYYYSNKNRLSKLDVNFFKSIYLYKKNLLLENLKDNEKINNQTLRKELLDGRLDAYNLCWMSAHELHPKQWEKYKLKYDNIKKEEESVQVSKAYKCRKCGENKCRVTIQQTRSADEPSTIFITCLNPQCLALFRR